MILILMSDLSVTPVQLDRSQNTHTNVTGLLEQSVYSLKNMTYEYHNINAVFRKMPVNNIVNKSFYNRRNPQMASGIFLGKKDAF